VGGGRSPVAERQKRWHLTLDRLTSRLAVGSVCVSRGVLRFSRDSAGLDPARLAVIPNGIDPAPYDLAEPVPRATIGIPADAHLVLCIGRLDPQKGLPDLLDAAERVIAAGPSGTWPWSGTGRTATGCSADRRASRPARPGPLAGPSRRCSGLLKSADLMAIASLWEGMPTPSSSHGGASGRCGTAVEGTEDLIVPGQTGWLVPPRQPDALGRALAEAADDPERRKRYGEAARLRVEHDFSIDATVAAYERLWASVLGYRPRIKDE